MFNYRNAAIGKFQCIRNEIFFFYNLIGNTHLWVLLLLNTNFKSRINNKLSSRRLIWTYLAGDSIR